MCANGSVFFCKVTDREDVSYVPNGKKKRDITIGGHSG